MLTNDEKAAHIKQEKTTELQNDDQSAINERDNEQGTPDEGSNDAKMTNVKQSYGRPIKVQGRTHRTPINTEIIKKEPGNQTMTLLPNVSFYRIATIFISPSLLDGTYYGMVMSVRPTLCPSVRLSVRPTLRPSVSPSARFTHFSHTCFDISSWNFAHDFVLMYYRSSLSVVTLRQFLKELCLFVNLEYRWCAVFCTFLLHALTYWAGIWHMTLFYCTTDQVLVSSISVNFCRSYASFGM